MKAVDLVEKLKEKNLSLSSMESVTGGLFASYITSVPGASKIFKGSLVSYCDEIKTKFGVKSETITTKGAISEECAKEMTILASRYFQTDISVSFTGNAGPDASEDKPIGLNYVAIKIKDTLYTYKLELEGEREDIREKLVSFAFKTILEKIA